MMAPGSLARFLLKEAEPERNPPLEGGARVFGAGLGQPTSCHSAAILLVDRRGGSGRDPNALQLQVSGPQDQSSRLLLQTEIWNGRGETLNPRRQTDLRRLSGLPA